MFNGLQWHVYVVDAEGELKGWLAAGLVVLWMDGWWVGWMVGCVGVWACGHVC
jgi:hypothetical protein